MRAIAISAQKTCRGRICTLPPDCTVRNTYSEKLALEELTSRPPAPRAPRRDALVKFYSLA